jgi:hypothetical protein
MKTITSACLLACCLAAHAATDLPVGTWVTAPTRGFPVQIVGFDRLVYAPAPVSKAVILGNYHEPGTEPNEALVGYDFAAHRWDVLDMGSLVHGGNMPEGGHGTGAMAWDPAARQFIYFGSQSGSNQCEQTFHLYWFDPLGQVGRCKQASPSPAWCQAIVSYFDVARRRWIYLGSGLWSYDPAANAWTDLQPGGSAPTHGYFSAMAYRTRDGRGYHFAGKGGDGCSNDLHAYDPASNAWTRLAPSGARPEPRF